VKVAVVGVEVVSPIGAVGLVEIPDGTLVVGSGLFQSLSDEPRDRGIWVERQVRERAAPHVVELIRELAPVFVQILAREYGDDRAAVGFDRASMDR